jgi:hypothetical protein
MIDIIAYNAFLHPKSASFDHKCTNIEKMSKDQN